MSDPKGTRGVASSEVPGGSRVSAETRRDPTVRDERFLRYIRQLLGILELDVSGRVTEVIDRALLDSYATISRGHHNAQREAVRRGVEILARMPDLLADLLVESGAYTRETVHDLATCPGPRGCGEFCSRILVPVVDGADAAPRDSGI